MSQGGSLRSRPVPGLDPTPPWRTRGGPTHPVQVEQEGGGEGQRSTGGPAQQTQGGDEQQLEPGVQGSTAPGRAGPGGDTGTDRGVRDVPEAGFEPLPHSQYFFYKRGTS